MAARRLGWSLSHRQVTLFNRRVLTRRAPVVLSSACSPSVRFSHTAFYDPRPEGGPPFSNVHQFVEHSIPVEDRSRTVVVKNSPRFAFAEDFTEFFEESGIAVDRVVIRFNCHNKLATDGVLVVLKSLSSIQDALKLTGEVLFNKRIVIKTYTSKSKIKTSEGGHAGFRPALKWGWYPSATSSIMGVKLRYPYTSPLKGIFEPVREGRHVSLGDIPRDAKHGNRDPLVLNWVYALSHHFNVLHLDLIAYYRPSDGKKFHIVDIGFETKEEADIFCQLYTDKDLRYRGSPVTVHVSRPPMKYLGQSWDYGHNRAHCQPRDHGSAKDTNFEALQDNVYRRWLLGKDKDRGLWVPGYKY